MEVHHHPQLKHEPKPWKEYLLEYIMIVLAVTTGFFAESLRETITDHAKEHEYIESMIEDAKIDTAAIHRAISMNTLRALKLDTMAQMCIEYKPGTDSTLYRLFRYSLSQPAVVNPTERTLSQLKSSGSMRLLRKKAAVDSILSYEDEGKRLENQQTYYERYLNEAGSHAVAVFNLKYFNLTKRYVGPKKNQNTLGFAQAKLMTTDPATLIQLGNYESLYGGVVANYVVHLHTLEKRAQNLIETLREQYNIDD